MAAYLPIYGWSSNADYLWGFLNSILFHFFEHFQLELVWVLSFSMLHLNVSSQIFYQSKKFSTGVTGVFVQLRTVHMCQLVTLQSKRFPTILTKVRLGTFSKVNKINMGQQCLFPVRLEITYITKKRLLLVDDFVTVKRWFVCVSLFTNITFVARNFQVKSFHVQINIWFVFENFITCWTLYMFVKTLVFNLDSLFNIWAWLSVTFHFSVFFPQIPSGIRKKLLGVEIEISVSISYGWQDGWETFSANLPAFSIGKNENGTRRHEYEAYRYSWSALLGRPTVFDQIYAFYLRSASAGICGPALDDIYDFQQRATKMKDIERNCVSSVSSWYLTQIPVMPTSTTLSKYCFQSFSGKERHHRVAV